MKTRYRVKRLSTKSKFKIQMKATDKEQFIYCETPQIASDWLAINAPGAIVEWNV